VILSYRIRDFAALGAILLALAILPRSITAQITGNLIPVNSRKTAPILTQTDIQGHTIELSHYKGKVVLLDFWAVACGGCKIEVPWYVEFDQKYKSKGLAVIGVDMYGESAGTIKPFMAESHMNYPVTIGNDAIGTRFDVQEMPLTLLIDRNGKIAVSHAGVVDKTTFERDIQTLLREKAHS
jgi:thiol-disulfide isomerase/thioredoxin